MIRILFITANPGSYLKLDFEYKQILLTLLKAKYGEEFSLTYVPNVSLAELQELLYINQPNIVHFACSGTKEGLLLENNGEPEMIAPDHLTEIFMINNSDKKIGCVFLNACYSAKIAEAISKYIDCVVGMSGDITDEAAITFAQAFYLSLGYGRSIKEAFDVGCNAIKKQKQQHHQRLSKEFEESNPKLRYAPGVDPAKVFLPKKL